MDLQPLMLLWFNNRLGCDIVAGRRGVTRTVTRGGAGGEAPLHFSSPLEKCVGHSSKLLDIVQKYGSFSENSLPHLVSQAGYGPG